MREVIREYGGGIIAAIATALVMALLSSIVFSKNGVMAKNVNAFATGYAGETAVSHPDDVIRSVKGSRKAVPKPVAKRSVFEKRDYDVSDVFDIPSGYTLRVTRVVQLDDLSSIEEYCGRANMAAGAYDSCGEDITEAACSEGGRCLCFPAPGYYALRVATATDTGECMTGVFLISVRS